MTRFAITAAILWSAVIAALIWSARTQSRKGRELLKRLSPREHAKAEEEFFWDRQY
jgi:hypothetical protein